MEAVVARWLGLHGLEGRSRWICEGATVLLVAWLEAGLHRLLKASLHGLLVAGLHWLLERCESALLLGHLLRHLRRRRHGIVASLLRHHAVLLVAITILLRHTRHLRLHLLHVLSVHHVGIEASQLGLQGRRRPKGTLLRVLWSGRRPHRRWRNATSHLLLWWLRSHAWWSKILRLCKSFDSSDLIKQGRCSTRRLRLLSRSLRRRRWGLGRLRRWYGWCWLRDQLWLKGWHIQQ